MRISDWSSDVCSSDLPDLVKDCGVGDELLLDDGRVVMRVDTATATELNCTVTIGGPLSDHKGINRRGGGLTAPALTEKDKADIKLRSEERRVGKECVRTCRFGCSSCY